MQRKLAAGAEAQDRDVVDISAGVAVGLIHTKESAASIIEWLVNEAEQVMQQRFAAQVHPG